LDDPEHQPLEYRSGPDPLDPGIAGLRDPSSGEGVAAFCLAALCPLTVVGTVNLFTGWMLCFGLPLSLVFACFALRLALRGVTQGVIDRGFGWASIVVLAVTYVGLIAWMAAPR